MTGKQETWEALRHSPTELELLEKVRMYERFLHLINTAQVSMNNDMMRQLIRNADNWSYAHRVGNGEYTDEEQDEMIRKHFDKLCDVDLKKK